MFLCSTHAAPIMLFDNGRRCTHVPIGAKAICPDCYSDFIARKSARDVAIWSCPDCRRLNGWPVDRLEYGAQP